MIQIQCALEQSDLFDTQRFSLSACCKAGNSTARIECASRFSTVIAAPTVSPVRCARNSIVAEFVRLHRNAHLGVRTLHRPVALCSRLSSYRRPANASSDRHWVSSMQKAPAS